MKLKYKITGGMLCIFVLVLLIGAYSLYTTQQTISYLNAMSTQYDTLSATQVVTLNDYINRTVWPVIIFLVVGFAAFVILSSIISGSIINPVKQLAAVALDIADGNINVNINEPAITKDEIGDISRAFLKIVQTLDTLNRDFTAMDKEVRSGMPHYRIADTALKGTFGDIISRANSVLYDYEHMIDLISEPFVIMDNHMKVTHVNHALRKLVGLENTAWADIVGIHINDCLHGDIGNHPATINALRYKTPQLEVDIQLDINGQLLDFEYNCLPFTYEDGVSGAVILMTNLSHIRNIQRRNEKRNAYQHDLFETFKNTLVSALQDGHLAVSFPPNHCDEDTKDIAAEQRMIENAVTESMGIIKDYVEEITIKLKEIANNNFAVSINRSYVGDFSSIKDSIGMITHALSMLVGEIQASTSQVESGAGLIAQATQQLMGSFEEQAAAMTEVMEAVNIITEKTQKNATDAQSASSMSAQVQDAAITGTAYMDDMTTVMGEIKQSSSEIAKVAGIIESIAFQTNLLALNASVEAARAGEHGKGFSVVADEVRSLAGRSAEAARETSEMIAESLKRVDEGVIKSAQTSESLKTIVEMTAEVVGVIANIANLSNEQAEEISKIQASVEALHHGITTNAASVQTNAAVGEELSSQSHVLKSLVAQFKISE